MSEEQVKGEGINIDNEAAKQAVVALLENGKSADANSDVPPASDEAAQKPEEHKPSFHKVLEAFRSLYKRLPEGLQTNLHDCFIQSLKQIEGEESKMAETVSLEAVQEAAWKNSTSYKLITASLTAANIGEDNPAYKVMLDSARAGFIQTAECPKEVPVKKWRISNSLVLAEVGSLSRQRSATNTGGAPGQGGSGIRVKDTLSGEEGANYEIIWRAFKKEHEAELTSVMAPATTLPNSFYAGKEGSNARAIDILNRYLDSKGTPEADRRGYIQKWADAQKVQTSDGEQPRFARLSK